VLRLVGWRVCGFWNYACVRRLARSFVWAGFRIICVCIWGEGILAMCAAFYAVQSEQLGKSWLQCL
jgi:hypothetical protein